MRFVKYQKKMDEWNVTYYITVEESGTIFNKTHNFEVKLRFGITGVNPLSGKEDDNCAIDYFIADKEELLCQLINKQVTDLNSNDKRVEINPHFLSDKSGTGFYLYIYSDIFKSTVQTLAQAGFLPPLKCIAEDIKEMAQKSPNAEAFDYALNALKDFASENQQQADKSSSFISQ